MHDSTRSSQDRANEVLSPRLREKFSQTGDLDQYQLFNQRLLFLLTRDAVLDRSRRSIWHGFGGALLLGVVSFLIALAYWVLLCWLPYRNYAPGESPTLRLLGLSALVTAVVIPLTLPLAYLAYRKQARKNQAAAAAAAGNVTSAPAADQPKTAAPTPRKRSALSAFSLHVFHWWYAYVPRRTSLWLRNYAIFLLIAPLSSMIVGFAIVYGIGKKNLKMTAGFMMFGVIAVLILWIMLLLSHGLHQSMNTAPTVATLMILWLLFMVGAAAIGVVADFHSTEIYLVGDKPIWGIIFEEIRGLSKLWMLIGILVLLLSVQWACTYLGAGQLGIKADMGNAAWLAADAFCRGGFSDLMESYDWQLADREGNWVFSTMTLIMRTAYNLLLILVPAYIISWLRQRKSIRLVRDAVTTPAEAMQGISTLVAWRKLGNTGSFALILRKYLEGKFDEVRDLATEFAYLPVHDKVRALFVDADGKQLYPKYQAPKAPRKKPRPAAGRAATGPAAKRPATAQPATAG